MTLPACLIDPARIASAALPLARASAFWLASLSAGREVANVLQLLADVERQIEFRFQPQEIHGDGLGAVRGDTVDSLGLTRRLIGHRPSALVEASS